MQCRCLPSLITGSLAFRLFTEGDELYDAMLASIASARRRIRLESYILAPDEIGWRFAEALAAKTEQGIEVLAHLDAAGSLFWSSQRLERFLRQRGVRVKWFHRWRWRDPLRYNRRDHRKLLVVDDHTVYLGGFNLHRESSRRVVGSVRWRDSHVRVEGQLAAQAAELFDRFWHGDRRWQSSVTGAATGIVLSNRSRACRHQFHCLFGTVVAAARQRVDLTTPYFVPDRATQAALVRAARSGVAVGLLVPGKTDVPVARWAARAAYAPLLRAGVRIYEYRPRVLHAKTLSVDGEWAVIGTSNIDYRSFFLNYEVNLVARDPGLCTALERQFALDLAHATEITAGGWARRPWPDRLCELIGWAARRWL